MRMFGKIYVNWIYEHIYDIICIVWKWYFPLSVYTCCQAPSASVFMLNTTTTKNENSSKKM